MPLQSACVFCELKVSMLSYKDPSQILPGSRSSVNPKSIDGIFALAAKSAQKRKEKLMCTLIYGAVHQNRYSYR